MKIKEKYQKYYNEQNVFFKVNNNLFKKYKSCKRGVRCLKFIKEEKSRKIWLQERKVLG